MPHILKQRADIPDGVLQVTDLKPNQPQKNNILEPAPGQTGYVNGPSNEAVGLNNPSGAIQQTAAEYVGLSAYLLERVENQNAGEALTAAIAEETANRLITRSEEGNPIEDTDVATALVNSGAGGGTTLTAGDSYGTVADILQILGGRIYTLPQGTEVQETGGAYVATNAGSFDSADGYVETLDTGALKISFGDGVLSVYKQATFEYKGTAGAAATVYNNDGSLYTV